MALQCGIVGLPNVGKSTLFNAVTNAGAQSANFPFCTIEPNVGTIIVPDERLFELEKMVNPQKVIPANMEIVDIAGLVKGAHSGEGLGNIRSTDAIIHVVRCFEDDNIVHVDGSVDPVRDKEVIDTELQLKDLESVEKALAKANKLAGTGNKEAKQQAELLAGLKAHLEQGKNARSFTVEEKFAGIYKELQLLTAKPVLYLCNVDENSVAMGNEHTQKFAENVKDEGAEILLVSASIESEIITMDREDQQMFIEEMGLKESGVSRLIKSAYKLLNYITYFTAGEKEVRAWTITKGMTAPQAAGVIHTDFEKGFIRAEVIHYADYVQYKSESACRDNGKLQIEGKEYIVQDGDIMHFRFNV